MMLKSRITRLEAQRPPSQWVPPIFFRSVVKPSENGSREVGAFTEIRFEGTDLMLWRAGDETNEN